MWASDYPHGTSTYPQSWDLIADVLDGVGEEDRRKLLCENVLATYGVPYEDRRGVDTATTGARS
jgi:predicted TIM-barrel fold metal-dependent hydrolase